MLRGHFASVIALALWAALILAATAGRHAVTAQQGRVLGCATITASVWALMQHYRRPALRDGEVVVTRDQLIHSEQAVREAWAAVHGPDEDTPRALRSV